MVLSHMTRINPEVTEEWKRPPEGYIDKTADDEDYITTRYGMRAIDRLFSSVDTGVMLPDI